jgi:hypothetical protein
MVGYKIYYELSTGNVILTIPDNPNVDAVPTTKEQDFSIYPVLAARAPETVGVIQLEYGQYKAEFQSARSWKVNPETKEIIFEFPKYVPPLTEQIEALKQENSNLKEENASIKTELEDVKSINANLTYQLMMKGVL